jgi:parallel beta-helix repeat protein
MLKTMRVISIAVVAFVVPYFALANVPTNETEVISTILTIPGTTEGTGTHFQIVNTQYPNITLDSSEPITLHMESVPRMITMYITPSASSTVSSSDITISGLVSSSTYYKYEDDYRHLATFITDANGAYSYTQDISIPHDIFIQTHKSTKFIQNDGTGGDCASIGTWDPTTLTCTLTADIAETIQIGSNGVTLDGNGHTLTGYDTGVGVLLPYQRMGITIKNLTIAKFSYGIYLNSSNNNTITNNTVSNNDGNGIFLTRFSNNNALTGNIASNNRIGISLSRSNNNTLTGNTTSNNNPYGIVVSSSNNNTLIGNTTSNNYIGIIISSNNNKIYNNNLIANSIQISSYGIGNIFNLALPTGGNYWSNYDTPAEGCNDSNNDHICDSPFIFYGTQDTFPWNIKQNVGETPTNQLPILTLLGDATTTLEYGTVFTDPGATASDSVDGDITNSIHVDGSVNTLQISTTTLLYSVINSRGISATTTRAVIVRCTADCYDNVLFLPGIEASRLYRPDYARGTDQLWEPNIDSDVQDLYMNLDGTSARNDVYTKDVIDEINILPIGQGNIYKSFIAQMNELKTSGTITDWEAAPYDWRLTLDDVLNYGRQMPDGRLYYSGDLRATSTPYIIQEIKRLAASSKTKKVTIVAHSNGGLVAKALTDKLGSEASALIDKIIFVAVPQVGTPQAIGAILHGYDQGLPFDSFPLVLTPETARILVANMPSAYNLLPSANYFTYVDNPVVKFDNSDFLAEFRSRYGTTIHDGAQLKNFITDTRRAASSSPENLQYPSVGNETLLTKAETVHGTLDNWTPPTGVSLYEIAGWGEDTLATIEYYEGKKTYCSNPRDIYTCTDVPTIMYTPKEVVDGDGTVVVPSALWTPTASTTRKYWVDLQKYNKFIPNLFATKHASLLEVFELRTLIKNILTNATSTPPTFITTTQPATDVVADKRLRFLLHSPLNLFATDNFGNIVNYATSTIPGGRWKRYGEVQVLTVPQNIPLTLNLDGYATGSFTLDMQEIDGNNTITASSTLSAIPSATSTQATMVFADGTLQNASPLLLDYDGNGTIDFSLRPKIGKAVVFDITPPEATLTFDPVLQKLKIIGTDNLSSTTISTTATSTTITDEAGNILQVIFKKFKQEGKEIKMKIQELRYNGVSVGELSKAVLEYEWSLDKTGKLKKLEEKATIGNLKVEGHYDAKKNITKIEKKLKEDDDKGETKEVLSGLVIIRLMTDKGKVGVNY